ncbi:Asp-tRNA(Asn)/Glu-tRNA(Gln) amidotransferase subunit GatC [Clostridium sp. BJN0001]|uniref:Asp-tRNA(Asn)/Glu-tRNA(Gln) amidotransferase subunit GatC n=1 Tax=Clostridium sp. BJN0001 TaxID=2930219 RepID=UPI001FD50128|nr:Asp-tRNA(Asn)/Glu-tRNA(Gln) amidotransferase subunit GatC [Clostridium sp. BJN0001]
MSVSIDEVKYIAKLSKLKFTDDEAEKFSKEFESVLDNFKYLNELDLSIKDDVKVDTLEPVERKDEIKDFGEKDLFRNVKNMQDGYLKVPKTFD